MESSSALINFLVPLVVAIITAIFSVWLSARRFRSERLWETKLKSYSELLVALHHIKHDTEISLAAEKTKVDTNTGFYKEWTAKQIAAWNEIRKQIDVNELFLSGRSVQLLSTLRVEASTHDGTDSGHLLAMKAAVERCLPALKAEARKDLQITIHPLWPNYYR